MSESLEPGGDSIPPVEQNIAQAADVSVLVKYLKNVIPALLEEDNSLHRSLKALLDDSGQQEKLKKFISDPQVKSLLIQRTSAKGSKVIFCIMIPV